MMTLATATRLKADIWSGGQLPALAKKYRLSLPAVYHIRKGVRWIDAPWPDGSTGGMPPARLARINKARRSAAQSVRVA